ncbi:unnamed protein product [Blepharisma stoltei]|uniref:J domain-containing protein n=1 Tax=Blepharisma stoltei TaxID=1481888 RepID=A0AAU9K1S8_9CILI|nr:unnamed protein product [Blepharisma stoltei]
MLRRTLRYFATYYEILDVPIESNSQQIKAAYYKLARKYHPDAMPNKDSTKFKEINEAYATLVDPSRREDYDRKILNGGDPHTTTSSTTESQDKNEDPFTKKSTAYGGFDINDSEYHKFWENTQKKENFNIYEQRRQEFLKKKREQLHPNDSPEAHKMFWDSWRDVNFSVAMYMAFFGLIIWYYRNNTWSAIEKKMGLKLQEEVQNIRRDRRHQEYKVVNTVDD